MSSSSSSNKPSAAPASASGPKGTKASTSSTTSSSDQTGSSSTSPLVASIGGPIALKDEVVLEYLKSKGMGNAVLELSNLLKEEKKEKDEGTTEIGGGGGGKKKADSKGGTETRTLQQEMELKEEEQRYNRSILSKSTGGGFGYDRDAAAPIAQWGVPDNPPTASAAAAAAAKKNKTVLGEHEARSYVDAFTALQLWILSLPDDSIDGRRQSAATAGGGAGWQPRTVDAIAKAKALIDGNPPDGTALSTSKSKEKSDGEAMERSNVSTGPSIVEGSEKDEESKPVDDDVVMTDASDAKEGQKEDKPSNEDNQKGVEKEGQGGSDDAMGVDSSNPAGAEKKEETTLQSVLGQLAKPAEPLPHSAAYPLPPSAKPELLAVSFALLVHTYCELLEAGMENSAHVIRDAFKPIYEPMYGEQYKDLYFCNTTEDIVRLNTHNSQHMDGLTQLKSFLFNIAQIQLKQEELMKMQITKPEQVEQRDRKLHEYNQQIGIYQQRHADKSQLASQAFEKMSQFPFLRRARAVRWQITLCTNSYALLCQFLNQTTHAGGFLAMSTLLQTKCELHIEQRDPLPFTPACILDDNATSGMGSRFKDINQTVPVQWAAPVARPNAVDEKSAEKSDLPFPKFHLEKEYEDERSARRGKRAVEFNRALVVYGFRRLEALERKRDFETLSKVEKNQMRARTGPETTTGQTGKSAEGTSVDVATPRAVADPLQPSILLSTLCANRVTKERVVSPTPSTTKGRSRSGSMSGNSSDKSRKISGSNAMSSFMWEESGIGITCAKLCPPDGRRIAIGCDDSAIRVWNLIDSEFKKKNYVGDNASAGDASQVLLGHKNGFPVFDLSWNRDGRSLLSAGGDGSIRLWDTQAQGSFGEIKKSSEINANAPSSTSLSSNFTKKGVVSSAAAREGMIKAKEALERSKKNPEMTVPGLREETKPYTNGAALAVYRGHAQHTPVWSVSFAPCGYYFASAGSDATARLWTTDRPVPVRLFTGHTSNSVHSVAWHPNANYVISGSEDKTCRLWDIQTGRCVRLLNGCPTGIYKVAIDPSGQYAAGSDLFGTVHLWDLATGKKMSEFRNSSPFAAVPPSALPNSPLGMNHALSFSPCGTALATGGDNRCVQVWNVKKAVQDPSPIIGIPVKSIPTRRTMILDLSYTKRNLLLSVGKYISAVPTVGYIKG